MKATPINHFLLSITAIIFAVSFSIKATAQSSITGKVTDENGSELIGAAVLISGTTTGTITDINGDYNLSVDPGTYTIEARFVGYRQQTQDVTVTDNASVTADFSLKTGTALDEVVIVGTRSRPRTVLESPVPIDAIDFNALGNSSQPNVSQILQYIAPSFHSTPQTISDGTDHVDPASLRGLGPDQTLVLVNGKRRHTSALLNVNGTVGRGTVGTDLNSIPAMAIKSIEILRDGAAAQYGSDAIAGVINIILQDRTEDASVTFETGVNMPNLFDGASRAAGNVPSDLIPDFKSDGRVYHLGTNFGFNIGQSGFVNVTGDYFERSSSNRSGNYTGSPYPAGYVDALSDAAFYDQVQDQNGFVEQQVMEIGNSALRNSSAVINSGYTLSDHAELYATFTFNYRDGIARGFYRFPSTRDRVVPQIYPNGFSPQIHSDINDNSFIIGTRGKIGEWNADFSQTRGENRFDFTIQNSNNASLGTSSPTSAYAGGFSYAQNTTNADFSRGFDVGFPINVAFGGEFRLETYKIFAGEEASYINGGVANAWESNDGTAPDPDTTFISGAAGIQVFPGFQPQNALNESRNNVALYGDFEFDFTDAFLVTLAGRFESYSDFGTEFTWKLASRYRINDDITARAAVSTGFRAPSLHQVFFNNLSTQFVDVGGVQTPVQVGTFNNSSNVTKAFGIDPLKAETSTNVSIGVTARLSDNWTFSVDGNNINIDDRIVVSGRFSPGTTLSDGSDAGDILIPLGAGAAQFFTNAVSTTTQGIDLVSTYRLPVGANGNLKLSLAANFTDTEVGRDSNGNADINASPLLEGLESTLFNREEISRIEVAQPKSKIVFSANFTIGKFNALFKATQFGKISYIHPSDGNQADWTTNDFTSSVESRDQEFDAKIVSDIELGYQLSDGVKINTGIHNFFNVYPDMHQHSGNASSGRFIYSRRVQQFGIRGAYGYIKLGVTF